MQTEVEIGAWEHECWGPAYGRNQVVETTCLVQPGDDGASSYVETHHDLGTDHPTVTLRGRVADIAIRHLDGSVDHLQRVPSGTALRGFDEADDGHLEKSWTELSVINDSNDFRLTIAH